MSKLFFITLVLAFAGYADAATCTVGQKFVSGVCTNCAAGKTSTGGEDGPASCTVCAAGKSSAGGDACATCATAGTFSVEGGACTDCPIGKWSDATSGVGACKDCGAGKSNSAVKAATDNCANCAAGKSSAGGDACANCAAGKSSAGGDACADCAAGKSSAAGAACTDCAAGKSSVAGAACSDCLAGKSSAAGDNSCADCAVGKISAAGAACTDCAAGKSAAAGTGTNTCINCAAGKSSAGGDACANCAAGKKSAAGAACIDCSAGETSKSPFTECSLPACADPMGATAEKAKCACYKDTCNKGNFCHKSTCLSTKYPCAKDEAWFKPGADDPTIVTVKNRNTQAKADSKGVCYTPCTKDEYEAADKTDDQINCDGLKTLADGCMQKMLAEYSDAAWTALGEQVSCSDDDLKAVKASTEGLKSVGHHIQVGVLSGVVAMIAAAFI